MSREDQAKVLCAGGSLFRKLQVEPGLLILAFVLRATSERSFRQSLLMSKGSPSIIFSRPISCALMVILLALVALQAFFRGNEENGGSGSVPGGRGIQCGFWDGDCGIHLRWRGKKGLPRWGRGTLPRALLQNQKK